VSISFRFVPTMAGHQLRILSADGEGDYPSGFTGHELTAITYPDGSHRYFGYTPETTYNGPTTGSRR